MRHISAIVLATAILLPAVAFGEKTPEDADGPTGPTADRSSLDWIKTEKIRAAYFHRWSSEELPGKVAEAGFNTMHVQHVHGHGDLKRWAKLARESNLRLIMGTWWSYPAHRQQHHKTPSGIGTSYRGYVNYAGRSHTRTVCPVDEPYWQDWIMPPPIEMTKLARETGLVGITLDPEMYGSAEPDGGGAYGWYYFAGPCYCDHCFARFQRGVEGADAPLDVPPAQRHAWLEHRELLDAYKGSLKENVQSLARRLEQAVHALDPDLLLGFLAVYDAGDFFFRGLVDGLKTPDRPVMIWTETPTYNKGYHPYVDETYRKFQAMGDVLYIPGLFLEAHAPLTLPQQVHDLAAHSDGYWIYTGRKSLLANIDMGVLLKAGNEKIAESAPPSEEVPFMDLWDRYEPVLTLPREWRLRLDPEDAGKDGGWFAVELDDSEWQRVEVGTFWDDALGQPFVGAGWYRVALEVPAEAAGKKLFIAFGAVDEEAWIWVNGKPAGEHAKGPEGWNRRFLLDVTDRLAPGQKNLLAVRVFNSLAAGGIWKPVRLIAEK